jgi:hypothetical protein
LILREEEMRVGLLLKSKSVDELVVLLEILIVSEEENDLIDVILGTDGRTKGSHEAVAVLDQIAVDD